MSKTKLTIGGINVVVLLFFIILIGYRYNSTKPVFNNGDKIRIRSNVTSEPVRYSNSQGLKLKGLQIYLPLIPRVYYGDYVVIEGVVEESSLKDPELLFHRESNSILYSLRKKILSFYKKNLTDPYASLIGGVTFGSKEAMPESFFEMLQKTGTLHVVVASGMNVTLVAGFLLGIFMLFLPRKRAVLFSIFGIWIYVLIAGLEAPLVRAGIMGSIAFTAQTLGRVSSAIRALVVSAVVMLLVWPTWLTDLGFILSFAATTSMMLFEPKIDRLIHKMPLVLRKDLSTTLAAQIGVAPILYYVFGQFNLLSPLINALVLWTIPLITVFGMMAGILGMIYEPMGRALLYFSYPLSFLFVKVIEIFV